jgi:uncharacterized protein YecE (DUF72 family)
MGKVYVGTSGFSYSHWGKGVFYPQDIPQSRWFEYYGQHFDTVELNVSFYRLPKKETFAGWRKRAGKDFVFAVKGSRYITHVKKLKDCQEPVKRFFKNAEGIKNGKDIVLWQLPPRLKANPKRLTEFLKLLPGEWRHAFEFRDESWLDKEIDKILGKDNIAVVFQDHSQWPMTEKVTADFVYLRLHGKKHLYSSCYTEKELKSWAKKIGGWQKRGIDCYTYFNNDALGYAVENAQTLKKLCSKRR